jgi:hypothetical protein
MQRASLQQATPFDRDAKAARLLAFSSLMARTGQELAVLMLAHFFAALFNDTTQSITSNPTTRFCNLVR